MIRTCIASAVFAAAVATLACSTSVLAQPASDAHAEARSIKVDLSAMNLASASGSDAVQQRIENAADKVCGGQPEHRLLKERAEFSACKRDAVQTALAQLKHSSPVVLARADTAVRSAAH